MQNLKKILNRHLVGLVEPVMLFKMWFKTTPVDLVLSRGPLDIEKSCSSCKSRIVYLYLAGSCWTIKDLAQFM